MKVRQNFQNISITVLIQISVILPKYFQSINGSPTPKTKLVQDIIEKKKLEKKSCVLIGDSINDYDAAKANGIDFYGYNNQALTHLGNYVDSFINIHF